MSLSGFDGVSFHVAIASLIAFGFLTLAVVTVFNSTVRAYIRKKRLWLLAVTVVLFLVAELLVLQIPNRAYREGVLSAVGTPDSNCPVSSQTGEPLRYTLMAPPVVFTGRSEIHLWVSKPDGIAGSHLCALALTPENTAFAEQALQAFLVAAGTGEDVVVELPSPPGSGAAGAGPDGSPSSGRVMLQPPPRPPAKTAQ